MPYKIAICDDNENDIAVSRKNAELWASDRGHTLNINIFSSAESFLFNYEEEKDYDILLLDIEMTGMDGVELAKAVRNEDKNIQIVFITGYSDYISEGYDVSALHYLMKPLKKEKFFTVLDRAVENIGQNERLLTLESGGETVRIPISSIRYLEVRDNYVTVHSNGEFTVKRALTTFEDELGNKFYRIGRSFIINLKLVARVTKSDVYLTDGSVIPLPRGAYSALNHAIIERT